MDKQSILAAMVSPLCSWYELNKRDFPWRKSRDPYRVWVSEIMLQQTRTTAAIPYYERFLQELPTVFALAEAPEEKLLKLWEGLGYYSRVRNMQKAAQKVVADYGGTFPKDAQLLSKLPGIGVYTAGAVASIAYGLPEPAVDGNVLRVLARLFCDEADILLPETKNRAHRELKEVYPMAKDCSDLTQGLMELGATVCLPGGAPKCDECPLAHLCEAKKAGMAEKLPVRNSKKEKKEVKRTVFLLEYEGEIALCRRPKTGVLSGMWEFPAAEEHLTAKKAKQQLSLWGGAEESAPFLSHKHVFTHLVWDMKSYRAQMKEKDESFFWVTKEKLSEEIPLPSAMQPFFRALSKETDTKN